MKHFKTLILLFTLIWIVTSCNKDEESTQGEYLKATINDGAFSSTFNQVIFTNSFEPPYKLIDITGTNDDFVIRITLSSYLEPGTYDLPNENHPLLGFEFKPVNGVDIWVASTNHEGTTGVLTITKETNSNIEGTFAFNAINSTNDTTVQVTNGEFNVKK